MYIFFRIYIFQEKSRIGQDFSVFFYQLDRCLSHVSAPGLSLVCQGSGAFLSVAPFPADYHYYFMPRIIQEDF